MSNNNMGYKRVIGTTRCNGFRGFRLNIRKLSIQRLRIRFLHFFKVFNKWKKTYEQAVRSLRKGISGRRKKNSFYSHSKSGFIAEERKPECRLRSLGRTNSFYTEAIADCLEFIKRNSISIDEPHDEAAPIAAALR